MHINEYLYSEVENDTRKSGEKIFDYVDPRNRNRQIEMEQACTEHLKEIGGYLEPKFKEIEFSTCRGWPAAFAVVPGFRLLGCCACRGQRGCQGRFGRSGTVASSLQCG